MKTNKAAKTFKGSISLTAEPTDAIAWKFTMLLEAALADEESIEKIAKRYGYTREHFYKIKKQYEDGGCLSLSDKPKGPKVNYKRTDEIEKQIIRHRFLDPEANSEVIAQKMNQTGHAISQRSVERTINAYGLQKKGLHKATKKDAGVEIIEQKTKRCNRKKALTPKTNEREFREMLAKKVSGTTVGLWLLVPALLKLGAWDILKGWTGKMDTDIEPRIALQLVNESALCANRVRRKNSLNHQGFQLLNGMSRLVSDEQVHQLLNAHTLRESRDMMLNLGIQRKLSGHYQGEIIAVDPHRIISSSMRTMPKKKKKPDMPSQKMLQTFFCVSAETGQPIMASMSSTGMPTTRATLDLINATEQIIKTPSLLIADKEHFTNELFEKISKHHNFDLLVPAQNTQRTKNVVQTLEYERIKAGFAIAETNFNFDGEKTQHRLIAERLGEKEYGYSSFLTTSSRDAQTLLCKNYDERWSVEEFFRFENDMGLNRASTLNLNIRYANLAMAMMAQAATYELRKNLTHDYKTWDAGHLANEVLAWNDGDVRVKDDTIIVTFYGPSQYIKKEEYIGLPNKLLSQGVNPKIPWLYDFKLDFRFK